MCEAAILPWHDCCREALYPSPACTGRALETLFVVCSVKGLHSQHATPSLPVIVESDQDGYFVTCPVLQGCYSQGQTYEEAIANIKDAICLHLDDRLADDEGIPEAVSVSLSTVEISA
jgi:predicted RNase H-like HicB family nuclease